MTQEDKQLLLKDLCGRLSNGVKCKILETDEVKILSSIQYDGENTLFDFWEDEQKIQYGYQLYLSEFKPYLFPLSSMTEEQKKYITDRWGINEFFDFEINPDWGEYFVELGDTIDFINWLNENHFDYRGLISMGLAIDATNLNIY